VGRLAARRVVALVQNVEIARVFAVRKQPSHTVSFPVAPTPLQGSVTVLVDTTGPDATAARLHPCLRPEERS
jgi:hypothetical protein